MNLDSSVPLKDQKERHNFFAEIVNAEKQLWGLIHSKGILHKDVQDFHRKVRSDYEKLILNDHEVVELQDVEYSLWKLHYKHIDEFRKRMRKTSTNADSRKSANAQNIANVHNSFDSHVEGFRTFLSEATEFYQNLITKLKRCYGLLEEHRYYKKGGLSCSGESLKLHRCQYSCHRFLVCLGDLARYMELCKKPDSQNCNWSVAATYYFEAAMTCPDSGNPQNQLALLATYIGDDFLALYHCVRSLAVKEPFPDAWDNLILLFEKNRLQHLRSLSSEANLDLLKPSERSISLIKLQSSCDSSNCEVLEVNKHDSGAKNDLWPLFVRMASFFFIKSSLEDFPCIFASTVRELEALVAVDGIELKDQLESYQNMDSARTGPYRALQVVCVLIFIIHSLNENQGLNESKENNDIQKPMLTQLAWTATLICMGRLLERCMKGDSSDFCPISPAANVFLEWLVGTIDKAETYCADEKLTSAMAYFFDTFVDLLNRLRNKVEIKSPDHATLWEDYELWGFAPIANAHVSLDFDAEWKCIGTFDSGRVCRAHRIFHAAMKIVERSKGSQRWFFYDKLGGKFYRTEPIEFPNQGEAEVAESISDLEVKEDRRHKCEMAKQYEKESLGTKQSKENGKSIAVEEEEVILFKPITRYNSAPIYTSITTNDQISTEGIQDETAPDECLRRASSLLIEQCQAQDDPLDFHSSITHFRHSKPSKQQPEPLLKESATYPAGPPSLSAWVLNRESLNIERERGTRDFSKHGLSPIQEQASASLNELSICQTEDTPMDSGHVSAANNYPSPPSYLTPVPSAPLLPDDTNWYSGNSFGFSDFSSAATKETDGILGTPPLSGYTNWPATNGAFSLGARVPGLNDVYPPLGLTSSEWLRQYNNSQKLQRVNDHTRAAHFHAPENLGNFHGQDASRFNLLDRWGNPLAYTPQIAFLGSSQLHPGYPLMHGADEGRNEKLFVSYQRPNQSGCYPGMDLRVEQPPVLQYLKEREWQLQQGSQVRGPTHMGN